MHIGLAPEPLEHTLPVLAVSACATPFRIVQTEMVGRCMSEHVARIDMYCSNLHSSAICWEIDWSSQGEIATVQPIKVSQY